jgi:hypothetical protein
MNTLPYYLYNLKYYPLSSNLNLNLQGFQEPITEEIIYKQIFNAIQSHSQSQSPSLQLTDKNIEDKINQICENTYYTGLTCEKENEKLKTPDYLISPKRRLFIGGTKNKEKEKTNTKIGKLAEISFTNPYYLLNHVSMDLCLLDEFYKNIEDTIIKDSSLEFNTIEAIIKQIYEEIEKIV